MRPTVLLFDVDGTLVTTGGAGRRAIERAFETLFGRPDACRHFRFDGMTDRAIVRQGLTAIGQPAELSDIEHVLRAYVTVLEDEVARAPAASYRVHDGMEHAVRAGIDAGFAVGLGTGNIREGARAKLTRVDLYRHFAFGGFGDDHEDRAELIRRGAERGAAHLRVPLEEARVVVIGDTPKDVAAARAIGAQSVAVATGHWSVDQLQRCGATWAFASLADSQAWPALLGTLDPTGA